MDAGPRLFPPATLPGVPTKKPAAQPEPQIDFESEETEVLADQIRELQDEARATFSLADRLAGLHYRKAKVVLFMDAQKGSVMEEMDKALQRAQLVIAGVEPGSQHHQDLIAAYTEAEEEKLAVERELMKDALSVHMQAVPDPIQDKARRAARKAVGMKGSVVPDDVRENYIQVFTDQLVGHCMTAVIDADGAAGEYDRKTIGRILRETLPIPQHARLVAAMNDLVFSDALARQATEDPGF